MTHKQRCIGHAMQYLIDTSQEQVFNQSIFNYYYKKTKKGGGNPFIIGLNAADLMINQTPKFTSNDTGNEK
jgi:hypothetical protein